MCECGGKGAIVEMLTPGMYVFLPCKCANPQRAEEELRAWLDEIRDEQEKDAVAGI